MAKKRKPAEAGEHKRMALDTVDDLVGDYLYYGRKEDEELGVDELYSLIRSGELTEAEVVARFAAALAKGFEGVR